MEHLSTNVILTRGASFEGCLSFEGVARLCGRFKGEIISEGMLIIEPEAQVEAKVFIGKLILKGWMKGEVKARQEIKLLSGSKFYGVLDTAQLYVEKGALFEGASVKPDTLKKEEGLK
ncbi:MAG: polymer-forming cytoskeletal protein [Oligoflexia bacterium]|nr:polymer-forming cytoskeletal protein [Bdellovibrionales bacterium]MYE07530.1 polymer-forming cytoskeletal protein [Oligoflexia bacterium]